ncbi:MAG: LytTR family DNA-binding domain-containing protein, partial [Oscillospiraceae bacterium]
MDGIETAMNIRRYDTEVPILIVTSTPEYAIDGYKVNASRYILKPVEKSGFLREVQGLLDRGYKNKCRYYSFTCDSGVVKLELDSIGYFESDMRTITAHTQEKSYAFTGKIKELEEQLKNQDFVRVHKSYIVNLRSVHRIFKDTITMSDGGVVPLSKNRSKEIHALLLEYMEKSL